MLEVASRDVTWTYGSTNRHRGNFGFQAADERGALAVEQLRHGESVCHLQPYGADATYVKLVGILAQGCVVLLDEVPANLVLGQIVGRSGGGGGVGAFRRRRRRGVLLVVIKITVCSHDAGFASLPNCLRKA